MDLHTSTERKSTPRFTRSPMLVLIRLVLTEIQPCGDPDAVFGQRPVGYSFLCKF